MRIPTALLRIGAALGNQKAQKTLDGPRSLKTITLKQIRNQLPTGWFHKPRIDPGVVVNIPRARLAALPPHPGLHAATPTQPCMPTSVSNCLPCIVASKDTSWLHHGPGARIPVPQNGRELHPLGLQRPSVAQEAPGQMDTLDRQAKALIQAEKDPTTFFGEMGEYPAEAIHVDSIVPMVRQPDVLIPDADYASDSASIAALNDSDSEDEWETLTPEEQKAADQQFDKETREIEAFEAMLNGYAEEPAPPAFDSLPPPPPPLPATIGATEFTSTPSLALERSTGPASPLAHAIDALKLKVPAAVAARQARALWAELPGHTASESLRAVPKAPASLLEAFAELDRRHGLIEAAKDWAKPEEHSDATSSSGDSGLGPDSPAPDYSVGDHEWGESTA